MTYTVSSGTLNLTQLNSNLVGFKPDLWRPTAFCQFSVREHTKASHFDASEKRYRRHILHMYLGLSVRGQWVCVSRKTFWTPYLHKPMKGISPNFDHRCIWVRGCADKIVGSEGQDHSRQWPEHVVNTIISETNKGNFTQFWSQMYLGSSMCWLAFPIKGRRSR